MMQAVYLIQAFAWGCSDGVKQGSPDAWGELMQHSQSPYQHGSLLSTKGWSGPHRLGKYVPDLRDKDSTAERAEPSW